MVGTISRHHLNQVIKVNIDNETDGRHGLRYDTQRKARHLWDILAQKEFPHSNHEKTSGTTVIEGYSIK